MRLSIERKPVKVVPDSRRVIARFFFNGEERAVELIKKVLSLSKEETFGPVAPIMLVEDEVEAISAANNSDFGLGGSIWTRDLEKAQKLSMEMECGIVTVNNMVASDPRVPFGGIKQSGFGRELSRYGLLEFVNVKSVRFYDKLVYEHHVE